MYLPLGLSVCHRCRGRSAIQVESFAMLCYGCRRTQLPTIATASCFPLAATGARSAAMSARGQQPSPPVLGAKLHVNKASTSGAGSHPSQQERCAAHQTTAKTHLQVAKRDNRDQCKVVTDNQTNKDQVHRSGEHRRAMQNRDNF